MSLSQKYHLGMSARIVEAFLVSKLPVVLIIVFLLAGAAALLTTPREEEPQIVVPMVDVLINFPGASASEVENLVTINLERRLWEIDGVEYIYSACQEGSAVVTVRFFVGEDRIASLVKTQSKIMAYVDQVPQGVEGWVVKPREIDDVPIVTVALYSSSYSDYELRRVADEILHRVQRAPDAGLAYVVGGRKRQIRVLLQPDKMGSRRVSVLEIERALKGANVNVRAGTMDTGNREIVVDAGPFIKSPVELNDLVVGVHEGRPIYLADLAEIVDRPEDVEHYTRINFGPGATNDAQTKDLINAKPGSSHNQITLAIAKRKGTNAVAVAEGLIRRVEELKGNVIAPDIGVLVTRNFGHTADEKINELMKHLTIAVACIIALLTVILGWRESLIVALAVPTTLAVTLFANEMAGYSINRVTLFALILSLGLLVDDPIVDVENIHRHYKLRTHPPLDATLLATNEVRSPTIMATLAVMAAFIPLAFITGMMGPYMRPMALNVPVAMITSLVVAFTITPWLSYRLLRKEYETSGESQDLRQGVIYRTYSRIIVPLLESPAKSRFLLIGVVVLLVVSVLLAVVKAVPLKMLPFDNKSEFLMTLRTPEGTTLEETAVIAADMAGYLATVNEVKTVESYVGLSAPIDFNGLVRHYYLRKGSNIADIRVNLVDKADRVFQSHALALRLRPEIEKIAKKHRAFVQLVEVPPGPPVLAPIAAEVYGPPEASYDKLLVQSHKVMDLMHKTEQVVDVDNMEEAPQTKLSFIIDRTKAALAGISPTDIARTAKILLGGDSATRIHADAEREPLDVNLRLPRDLRSKPEDMGPIRVKGADGSMVPFHELGELKEGVIDKTIYRKNLRRVVYVLADTAGRSPVYAILDLLSALKKEPLPAGFHVDLAGEGEWKITLDVFRDLGLGFLGALVLIYVLLLQQTKSFTIPLIIMAAIPLTMIGIMPGFALLNLLFSSQIGPYRDSIFFTATAMIGMIALAGIVVRNSIILIDFIHVRTQAGEDLKQAVIESGAVRFTPILLTAGAAIFGSWVITLDPVFSGLAWSFIFGIFASTLFTLVLVPVIYYWIYRKRGNYGNVSE